MPNDPSSSLQPEALCEIEQVTSARVSREDELSCRVELSLKDPDKEVSTTSLYDFFTQSEKKRFVKVFLLAEWDFFNGHC